ncbi:hypothetical protein SEA_PICARD_6 [Streptomyces phage Picard]|uniref:Uncharacterized protein n=1 Tax=Streptomyces phage Picard TaxID=1920311 RepID=A0A1J0MC84_9CAUD|nr:hypothetical protein HOR45_gp06 [Streptomyces phage Picard]APD18538.1 hypothetical protein SEA_PICARD_6 [Streptomyces phage Picard]
MPPEPAPTPTPSTGPSTPPAPAPAAPPAGPPTPAPAPTPTAPPTPAPAPAPTVPAAPPAPAEGDLSALPEWAQERIRAAEAAKEQAPAPTAPEPGAEGDLSRLPKWAQQQLTAAMEQAKTAAIQAAVLRTAPTAGANVAALLDSQSAMTALAAVDPTDTAAVTAAIQAAVQAQPHLAAGPSRGGADFGTATPPERKPGSLHDAIAARLGA